MKKRCFGNFCGKTYNQNGLAAQRGVVGAYKQTAEADVTRFEGAGG